MFSFYEVEPIGREQIVKKWLPSCIVGSALPSFQFSLEIELCHEKTPLLLMFFKLFHKHYNKIFL